jgi:hypothetical protein
MLRPVREPPGAPDDRAADCHGQPPGPPYRQVRHHAAKGLEADAAELSFHLVVAEASGSGVLVGICDSLWRGQIDFRIWQEIHTHMRMEALQANLCVAFG